MSSFNRTILMGNLTRDPELKTLPSGTQIADLAIAVNERMKKGDEWIDQTSFFDLVAFGKSAENISRFFSKGKPILIEGKLRQRSWEDKNSGQKRSKVEVIVDSWTFCEGRQEGGNNNINPFETPQGQQAPLIPDDSGIPF